MNHQWDKFFVILFVLQGILFWQPGLQAAEKIGGRDVIFYYSNNVQGETEPCG